MAYIRREIFFQTGDGRMATEEGFFFTLARKGGSSEEKDFFHIREGGMAKKEGFFFTVARRRGTSGEKDFFISGMVVRQQRKDFFHIS